MTPSHPSTKEIIHDLEHAGMNGDLRAAIALLVLAIVLLVMILKRRGEWL